MKKTYAQKITNQKRHELLAIVDECIDNHEKFKNSYFWDGSRIGRASSRRKFGEEHSFSHSFMYDGIEFEYVSDVSVSCKNVYYSGCFYQGNTRKDVRVFKKIQKELMEAIETYEAKHNVEKTA